MSKNKDEEKQTQNPFIQEENKSDENISETIADETETQENNMQENQESADDTVNKELEVLKNQYVRMAADFDNYRKRQAQERESLLKYGAENTLKLLLPILDTYERAKKSCENLDDAQKLKESFDVVFKQLFDALEKSGLKKIETVGKEFDPNLHEAVMQTPTNEHPDQSIIEEMQAGYMLLDRVLRPAMVNVATAE